MKRTFVIGDPHGCARECKELLDKCQVTSSDRVIFVGDLIDRGPDNAQCVDLVMEIEKKQDSPACVLGNHESRHLDYRNLEEAGKNPNVSVPTHIETRKQLTDEHYAYFRSLPLYIRLPEFNAVVVHAGVWPNVPIEQQNKHHLLHCQMIYPGVDQDGHINKHSKWPSKAASHWKFWTHYWTGPEIVIFGHSVLDRPLSDEFAIGIDGGAVFGRELWAVEMPGGKIHRVKSKTNADHSYRGRPSEDEKIRGNRIKVFNIHGDVGTFS